MKNDIAKQRLGKGLAALIGDLDKPFLGISSEKKSPGTVFPDREVPIELLRPNPNNPRKIFSENELHELANSITKHGIVQPILVRSLHETIEENEFLNEVQYEIIAGERRWRAAQRAGISKVPILLREVGDSQALEIAIVENIQRSDLNAIDEAFGYQQLIEEYDYTQMQLGQVISKSRSHISNTLRLLKLPLKVREMVTRGSLSAGHARAMVVIEDEKSVIDLADKIIKKGLSVRQTEKLAQSPKKNGLSYLKTKTLPKKSVDTLALEKRLEVATGMKFSIDHHLNGSGKIRISYKSLEQLDEICKWFEKI